MDVYRALNADVPQLLFTVLHQAGPTISDEEFIRTVTALQMDIRKQVQEISEQLRQWLVQQYSQQAEETIQKDFGKRLQSSGEPLRLSDCAGHSGIC